MKQGYTFLLTLVALCLGFTAQAQDPILSQFYLNKLYMNPAYTGINRDLGVNLSSRRQWTNIPGAGKFRTHVLAADFGCPEYKMGFGLIVLDDLEGEGLLKTTEISPMVSSHIRLSRTSILSFGGKLSLGYKAVDYDNLIFSDQLDPIDGAIFASAFQPGNDRINNIFGLSAGALFRQRFGGGSFWSVGFSGNNLYASQSSFLELNYRVPIRYTVHSYQHFRITRKNTDKIPNFISSGMIYERQAQLNTFTMGASITVGHNFLAGIWYRNRNFLPQKVTNDAIIFSMVSFYNDLAIGYSYDLTVSDLGSGRTHGTHEISISYIVRGVYICKAKRKKRKDESCYLFDPRRVGTAKANPNSNWGKDLSPFQFILP